MTNLEALTATVNYPIDSVKVQKILIDNGFNSASTYDGNSKSFDLATAGLYQLIATSANLSEGDLSVSLTEKNTLLTMASKLYQKHGVVDPLANDTIRNRSNYW